MYQGNREVVGFGYVENGIPFFFLLLVVFEGEVKHLST